MSQRERLLGRKRPSVPYRLLVDEDGVRAAREALALAQVGARSARAAVDRADAAVALRKAGPVKGRAALVRAAEAELATVQERLVRAEQAVADAEATVDGCYETIVLRAMEPSALEELVAAHPPTAEQLAKAEAERQRAVQAGEKPPPPLSWNVDTFRPALLTACAEESGMTEQDWAAFFGGNLSSAETTDLWRTVLEVNHRTRVADPVVLPKDWMEILSSRSS